MTAPMERANSDSLVCAVTSPSWQHFPVLVLQFEVEMLAPFQLPPFAGSLFRGVLGWSLREVCDTPTYDYLFETSSDKAGQHDAARPFVLIPPTNQRQLAAGDRFRLDLHLLGAGCDYSSCFVEALQCAGRYGLGRERAPFDLLKISVLEGRTRWICYEKRLGWSQAYLPLPSGLGSFVPPLPAGQVSELEVEFLTPTRLVHQGQRVPHPDFHVVLRALYRRLDGLLQHHAGLCLDVDFIADIQAAQQIVTQRAETPWVDWERTSSRQGRHLMGGLVGRALYRGAFLPHWLPLLSTASVVHLGKATTFGMGALKSRVVNLRSTLPPPPQLSRKAIREETVAGCPV